jgi:hypothetical protein
MPILCRRGGRYVTKAIRFAAVVWEMITGVTHANIMSARWAVRYKGNSICGGRLGNDHRCYPCQYYVGAVGGTLQRQFDLRRSSGK